MIAHNYGVFVQALITGQHGYITSSRKWAIQVDTIQWRTLPAASKKDCSVDIHSLWNHSRTPSPGGLGRFSGHWAYRTSFYIICLSWYWVSAVRYTQSLSKAERCKLSWMPTYGLLSVWDENDHAVKTLRLVAGCFVLLTNLSANQEIME